MAFQCAKTVASEVIPFISPPLALALVPSHHTSTSSLDLLNPTVYEDAVADWEKQFPGE